MELQYILPDWDDYLDPEFDFVNDEFSDKYTNEGKKTYIYEMMGNRIPCNGILVSLAQLFVKKGILKDYTTSSNKNKTIREIMRVPDTLKIIGDCGAFSYKDSENPTFTPEQAADIYAQLGVDIGASVDHMVIGEMEVKDENGTIKKVPFTDEEQRRRISLTIRYAEKFIEYVKSKGYKFDPMGVIQGITRQDYSSAFEKYIKMGYEKIALGTLVPRTDEDILGIIQDINEILKRLPKDEREKINIHLFGVLRPNLLGDFRKNGITSFDSISFFRKAWLRSTKNYLGVDGQWYAALRVPQANKKRSINNLVNKNTNLEYIQRLETEVLTALVDYDNDCRNIDEVLDLLVQYDSLFERTSENGDKIRTAYRKTLEDKPWKHCTCPFCREIGIQVLIFRGANRNKRRGFHNTVVFYNELNRSNSKGEERNGTK